MGFEVDVVAYIGKGDAEPTLISIETDESATAEDPIRPYPTSVAGTYYSFDRLRDESIPSKKSFNRYVRDSDDSLDLHDSEIKYRQDMAAKGIVVPTGEGPR